MLFLPLCFSAIVGTFDALNRLASSPVKHSIVQKMALNETMTLLREGIGANISDVDPLSSYTTNS